MIGWIKTLEELPKFKDGKVFFIVNDEIKEGVYYNIDYNGVSKHVFAISDTGSLTFYDTDIVKYWCPVTFCEKCKKADKPIIDNSNVVRMSKKEDQWYVWNGIKLCRDCFDIVWRNFVMEAK